MSQRQITENQESEIASISPEVFVRSGRKVHEFMAASAGEQRDDRGGFIRTPRPFGRYKSAFAHTAIVAMVRAKNKDAVEFVGALLDVLETAVGGTYSLEHLVYTVGTGTSLGSNGWMYSVLMTLPMKLDIRMAFDSIKGSWSYIIEYPGMRSLPARRSSAEDGETRRTLDI